MTCFKRRNEISGPQRFSSAGWHPITKAHELSLDIADLVAEPQEYSVPQPSTLLTPTQEGFSHKSQKCLPHAADMTQVSAAGTEVSCQGYSSQLTLLLLSWFQLVSWSKGSSTEVYTAVS